MCATCGCNYKNYQHRPDEMKTTMGGSYKGIDKIKQLPAAKVVKVKQNIRRGKR
jgi:hypothetical protein